MQHNPFENIDTRFGRIEVQLSELKQILLNSSQAPATGNRYGNFSWYISETGQAESTARQRIARGEVPGVTKLGKRLLFDKETILKSLENNQRKTGIDLASTVSVGLGDRRRTHRKKGRAIL